MELIDIRNLALIIRYHDPELELVFRGIWTVISEELRSFRLMRRAATVSGIRVRRTPYIRISIIWIHSTQSMY